MSWPVEVIFVWFPIVASVAFVVWFGVKMCLDGTAPVHVLVDRRFLTVFLYTGALLAIYLSSFHFFYVGLTSEPSRQVPPPKARPDGAPRSVATVVSTTVADPS
ncbi:MAG: hypothetical protein OXN89_18740 [Bryobacterales bacterium]|nr:hypothetical protein [Bryobacterales bacterium]